MSQMMLDDGPPSRGGRKIMLATTVYEKADAGYTFAIARSREALHVAGLPSAYLLLQGNCHVDDARNSVVREFLLSDCTELVFIDADVSWEPASLVALCDYDADVVGGIYPHRGGMSGADMPVFMIPGLVPDADGLLEVYGLPTGFMRIRRSVLEALDKTADQHNVRQDARRTQPVIFERTFQDGMRLGGDIAFCRKWEALGGKVHAAVELRLGHAATITIWDSLGAAMRQQTGATLRHLVSEIRAGRLAAGLFAEARRYCGNEVFGALEDVLMMCAVLGRRADGPIIEAGSGLTTIVLAAAAPDQQVWCLEHDPRWAFDLRRMVDEAGLSNVTLVTNPIKDGWYDLTEDMASMPDRFALGLNDGPPRSLASRMGFFDVFGDRVDTIIADDADDLGYADAIGIWARHAGMSVQHIDGGQSALITKVASVVSIECPDPCRASAEAAE